MKINQRDVLMLPHPFGNGNGDPYPHIVLSVQESNHCEQTFTAVMFTSSLHTADDYSFYLDNDMFEKPLVKEACHVRMYLVVMGFNESVIPPKMNRMKQDAFARLMREIGRSIFHFEFRPRNVTLNSD